ncbi:MAG TPA: gamma-glutamyltransferase [Mycobacteriales bacterium]|nr:gamma-glutamyltransferase [Mycobacteriales bacterium]
MAEHPDSTRHGLGGAVCSVDHLASAAGLAILRVGGTAADAAVAASAVLAVTTQHMCGAGGDLLALVRLPTGEVEALVAVGRAGSGSDPQRLRAEGHDRMPFRGDPRTVTVPGCVDGWLALHARHGRLPLASVLAPAIGYARGGFPVSPLLASALPTVADVLGGEELVGSLPVSAGDIRQRPLLGAALQAIAREGRQAWYGGAFGRGLLRVGGGVFTEADLARDLAEWTSPTRLQVDTSTLLSTPPPTAGHLVLSSAWIANAVGALGSASDDDPHLLVEASRLAGFDRPDVLADGVDAADLVGLADLQSRAGRISPDVSTLIDVPAHGGGTVYLCAADSDGMVVSLSQSNAAGFGSGLAVREVGVFLHNRGLGFSLQDGHPAELRPGARPPHTLVPSMLVDPDGTVTALGTMGGDAQPQILLQLVAALRAGATPAAALARPRWAITGPMGTGFDTWEPWPQGTLATTVALEEAAPLAWSDALRRRGHLVERQARGFGHAHLIVRRADGLLSAASDLRAGTGDAQCF